MLSKDAPRPLLALEWIPGIGQRSESMSQNRPLWIAVSLAALAPAAGCSSPGTSSMWPSGWFGGGNNGVAASMGQPRNVTPQRPSPSGANAQLGAPAAASTGMFSGITASMKSWTSSSSPSNSNDQLSLDNMPKQLTPELHLYIAGQHESNGKWADALKHYDEARKAQPGKPEIVVAMARCFDHSGDAARAEATYHEAIRVDRRCALAHNDLGLFHARRGNAARSLEHLSQAVALVPTSKLYRNNYARMLGHERRYAEAFEQLSAFHPPALAHYNVGITATDIGDRETALACFQRALEADPNLIAARRKIESLGGAVAQTNPPAAPSPRPHAQPASSSKSLILRPSIDQEASAPPAGIPLAEGPINPPPSMEHEAPQTSPEAQAAVREAEAKLRAALQAQPAAVAPSYGGNWVPEMHDDITPIQSIDQVPEQPYLRPRTNWGSISDEAEGEAPILLPPVR
jgi:Tfp pilus assembly protein PilF